MPKTTKEGDPDKDFFLNNRAAIFRPIISEKSLKRGDLMTFLQNKKRKNSKCITRRLNTFLPKNTKALSPRLDWSITYWAPHKQHISRKKTGLKYWLGTFWQKLIKQSIFMHFLPNKTFFCQKPPGKVTPTKIFF